MQRYRKNTGITAKWRWLLFAILLCAIALTGFITARYATGWNSGDTVAKAQSFYFTSDHLEAGDYPVYKIAVPSPQNAKIEFDLQNFLPSGGVSSAGITYKYTVTVNGAEEASLGGSGNLPAGIKTGKPITISGLSHAFDSGKATVRVVADAAPYAQTLGAIYELYAPIQGVDIAVSDTKGSNTLTMLVTTGAAAGTVTMNWSDANILPNNADSHFITATASSCQFNAEADAQYSFVFMKKDPSRLYDASAFSVPTN